MNTFWVEMTSRNLPAIANVASGNSNGISGGDEPIRLLAPFSFGLAQATSGAVAASPQHIAFLDKDSDELRVLSIDATICETPNGLPATPRTLAATSAATLAAAASSTTSGSAAPVDVAATTSSAVGARAGAGGADAGAGVASRNNTSVASGAARAVSLCCVVAPPAGLSTPNEVTTIGGFVVLRHDDTLVSIVELASMTTALSRAVAPAAAPAAAAPSAAAIGATSSAGVVDSVKASSVASGGAALRSRWLVTLDVSNVFRASTTPRTAAKRLDLAMFGNGIRPVTNGSPAFVRAQDSRFVVCVRARVCVRVS